MSNLQLVHNMNVEVSTIATSAVLLDLSISVWGGRKRDRATSDELMTAKQAGSTQAASVTKNLMSDDKDLDAVRSYAADTRVWLSRRTLAWNDSGTRLLPSSQIFEVTSELESRATEFHARVDKFLATYNLKVSAAAFKLGQLFKREEYPTADDLRRKFRMQFVITPVPTAGDFRVDVQNDTATFLKDHFEKAANERYAVLMREPWERVFETLKHAQERLAASIDYEIKNPDAKDGRKSPKLFQSLLDNALELAQTLEHLNVTKDPKLADCALRIRQIFSSSDIKSLRESPELKTSMKAKVDALMSAFDFGGCGDSEE